MEQLIAELDALYDRADEMADRNPLKLVEALGNVLSLCKGMTRDFEGKPNYVGAAFAEQVKREVWKALE